MGYTLGARDAVWISQAHRLDLGIGLICSALGELWGWIMNSLWLRLTDEQRIGCVLWQALEINDQDKEVWNILGQTGGGVVAGIEYSDKQCYQQVLVRERSLYDRGCGAMESSSP